MLTYKLRKYPVYDGLEFGYVRGRESAFLLQNICPVKRTDIDKKYIDKNTGKPVTISSNRLKRSILQKARKLIGLSKRGFRVTQTDIAYIYNDLMRK